MKKELIVDLIEKLINNEPCDLKLLANASPKTSVEEFLLNTAYRLMNTYIRYNEGRFFDKYSQTFFSPSYSGNLSIILAISLSP